jgi:hypothetical protein
MMMRNCGGPSPIPAFIEEDKNGGEGKVKVNAKVNPNPDQTFQAEFN